MLIGRTGTLSLIPGRVIFSGRTTAVEFLLADKAGAERLFFQRRPVLVRGFGDFGGVVVADLRRQRGHQHQRALHQLVDALAIGLDPDDAAIGERTRRIGQQA